MQQAFLAFAHYERFCTAVRVRNLSYHLMCSPTASHALEAWCERYGLSTGQITAMRRADSRPRYIDEEVLDDLRLEPDERLETRRVLLVRGGLPLCEVDNWFIPRRLPPDVMTVLQSTNVPFGRAIRDLDPGRRTYFVRLAGFASEDSFSSDPGLPMLSPSLVVLEHRAMIYDGDRLPLAVVTERYLAGLVGARGG